MATKCSPSFLFGPNHPTTQRNDATNYAAQSLYPQIPPARIGSGCCRLRKCRNSRGMRTYNVLMPWKASSVMEEKLRFIFEYERKESTMGELCSRFGISRETGYVVLRRFRQYGLKGLEELDRAPLRHPN